MTEVQLYFRLYPGQEVDATRAIAFLKALDQELQASGFLLWDRLNAHRAKKTTAHLEIRASPAHFLLSPYAPELNPVEYLWGYRKMNPLANRTVHEVSELAVVTRSGTRSLQTEGSTACVPSSDIVLFFCAYNRTLLMQDPIANAGRGRERSHKKRGAAGKPTPHSLRIRFAICLYRSGWLVSVHQRAMKGV